MQNDHPQHVVHCQNNEDIMVVENYCSSLTKEFDDKKMRMEYWWSREFELLAPEDLEGLEELKNKLKEV